MDEHTCPLCQQPNLCGNLPPAETGALVVDPAAVAVSAIGFDCWCLHQPVSTAALETLTPQQRGKRCICQACAAGLSLPPETL